MAQKDSKHIFQQKLWLGTSNLLKEPSSQDPDNPTNYYYSENMNVRTDPYAPTLNPASLKESGGTVTDFVKWADITPASLITYFHGDTGNIYQRGVFGTVGGTINSISGPNNPTTTVDDATVGTVAWPNPNNAQVSDNVYATASLNNSTSHYLKATNFGFSIPTGATITGIFVEIERKTTTSGHNASP